MGGRQEEEKTEIKETKKRKGRKVQEDKNKVE